LLSVHRVNIPFGPDCHSRHPAFGNGVMPMKNWKAGEFRILGYFLLILLLASGGYSIGHIPQDDSEIPDSCTSIQVGRLATADGSVITCHTCDGGIYRNWLNIVPHKTHAKEETNKIYWGSMQTEFPDDLRGKTLKGEIPEVEETYAFMNVAYPCLNEKQLAIGETTIGGRRELENKEGMFLIEELERVALERCSTARDALKLIGELVKKYGYGDGGECITIADKKEVWQLEIMGSGPGKPGAVWAAARIPDDHVGVSANIPRISEIDLKNPDRYLASDNVYSLAEKMGWWKQGESFKFWKAYSGRKPFSDRELYILGTLAPELNLNRDLEELPFSVKPARKLSVQDIMKYYRETYEGSDMDPTKNLMVPRSSGMRGGSAPAGSQSQEMVKSPIASAWMGNDMIRLLNALKPGVVPQTRAVAVPQCAYSEIIQVRPWMPDDIGAVAWFSFDNPAQSPRIPIFSSVLSLPKSFEIDAQKRYRADSAAWMFRRTNRLATIKWGSTRGLMEGASAELEKRAFAELPAIEGTAQNLLKEDPTGKKTREYLTQYTGDFARAAMSKWSELEGTLWNMFSKGF
jgi:dipeptidase